ncbi:Psi-producing oxygenase C [Termitomyces sp. T112]|nr:Psi-producing oxygenase C [Termitomyces sp. T112]
MKQELQARTKGTDRSSRKCIALSIGADAIYLKNRPLPEAPTGYYDWQITTDPFDDREGYSRTTNLINKVESLKSKGLFKPNLSQVDAFFDTVTNPTAVDDRKGAFNTGLGILARLDPNSHLARRMNNSIINMLYNTVPHPPASYLGPHDSFRHADGGGNNLQNPDLGRAGRPYAKSVQGKAGLPRASLPDPGLVFDTILMRHGTQIHPGGMSSLIFAFASIVTHSLFRTDPKNIYINNASSYLDLSPLYGDNQAAQDKVRDKVSGRGLLFPDTFSEDRLLFLPPATSVLLVIFSRNHNYIARRILKINEHRRWYDPPPTDPANLALQDEEIFQTARLINCGHFMSAIMGDYVTGFLGMSEGSYWDMKPFDIIQTDDMKVDRGLGNHVSVEFNILYRWHATLSDKDLKWTEDVFREVFADKPFEELSLKDLGLVASLFDNIASNPAERTFAGLMRSPDGTFSDDDLAEILYMATENPAGAFRGRGTPTVLRLVEIMGIEQSRAWGVCTMNEFRKFLGLREFETFEEWNPDPEIASAARRLYGHIDNLELYTGLQAESIMPLADASRFACGYTTTRAVLGDAIALVRGDRFNTSDFTPANLTTWGFYDCQRDMNNGGMGGQIPKLLLRHLPRHFTWNSVYSLYPFFTPQKMKDSLTRRKIDRKYTFDRPKTLPATKILSTFAGIKAVFNDPSRFKVIYERKGHGSALMFDEVSEHATDKAAHTLFPDKDSLDQHVAAFSASIVARIKEKSWKYFNVSGNHIDVVKDVINPVSAHFSADKMTGIDLKTRENPSGLFTENEYFDLLTVLYTWTFLTLDDLENRFSLQEAADQAAVMIGGLTAKSIIEISPSTSPNLLGQIGAHLSSFFWPRIKKPCYPFLSNLAATGRPIDELIGNILGVAVGACVNYAHAAVNVIDFYLDDARVEERKAITKLVATKSPQNDALLLGYVCEAMRLQPQYPGLWREATENTVIDQGSGLPPVELKAGDRIWASFRNAHLNPLEFPEPTKVNPTRPLASYNLQGVGFHRCPGETYTRKTIVDIVKAIFSLRNVRRAPGDAGRLYRFSEVLHETEVDFFVQRNGTVSSWPGSMIITYDD